jgi:hypothetical protein
MIEPVIPEKSLMFGLAPAQADLPGVDAQAENNTFVGGKRQTRYCCLSGSPPYSRRACAGARLPAGCFFSPEHANEY